MLSRDTLSVRWRFLGHALTRLVPRPLGGLSCIATDGVELAYSPGPTVERFGGDPAELERDLLQLVVHCLLSHPFATGVDFEAWSLATDIAAEECVLRVAAGTLECAGDADRLAAIERLEKAHGPIGAEKLYRLITGGDIGEGDCHTLERLFHRDDHVLWPCAPRLELDAGGTACTDASGSGEDDESLPFASVARISGAGAGDEHSELGGRENEKSPGAAGEGARASDGEPLGGEVAEGAAAAGGVPTSDAAGEGADGICGTDDTYDTYDTYDAYDDYSESGDPAAPGPSATPEPPATPELPAERAAREWSVNEQSAIPDTYGGPDARSSSAAREWSELSRTLELDLETRSGKSPAAAELASRLAVANAPRRDWREFLLCFAETSEEMHVDDADFDPVFYTYGLRTYGDMPLVEPLETRESRLVRDFAVVIDTSASVKGDLVMRFAEETFRILTTSASFAERVRIHIIQCDSEVRSDVVVTSEEELAAWKESFELEGFGGTDFRPAFEHVTALVESGELTNLRGLVYFTDGKGTYPDSPPPYDAAFVFCDPAAPRPKVPPWAFALDYSE